MSPGANTEWAFEDRVEYELLRHGWTQASGLYSAELGIHTGALWEFVGRTQNRKWNKLIELYGGDPDVAQRQFALRVAAEIDSRACWMCCVRALRGPSKLTGTVSLPDDFE